MRRPERHDVIMSQRLSMVRCTLTVAQASPGDGPSSDQHWVCPRQPALTGPLFHTGLKADQAVRLKPDAK